MKHVRFTKILQNQKYLLQFFAALFVLLILTIENSSGATKTWIGGTGTNLNWTTGANWGGTAPVAGDDIIFNTPGNLTFTTLPANVSYNSLTINQGTITLAGGNTRTFTLGDNAGVDFTVANGASFGGSRINITLATNATATISGTLSVAANRTFNTNGTTVVTTVTGTLINSGTVTCATATKLLFNSSSTYQHALNGGTIPTATWDAASTCNVTGITNTVPTVAGFNQAFGNFTWNCTGQSGNISLVANLKTINGNFTVSSTNASQLILSAGTATTLTVLGNFSMTNGTLNFNSGANISAMNVAGNFTHTAGTITESNTGQGSIVFNGNTTQSYTSGGTVSNAINFTVNNGTTLQMADNATVVGNGSSGTFTLSSGATLGVTSADGITTTGATGNIRVGGARTYNSGANYIYNGSGVQVTGAGLTQNTPANLTINNPTTVTLSGATTISGNLLISQGTLSTSGNNYNMNIGGNWTNNGGIFTPGNGTVTFTDNSSSINGTATTQTFNNLTVNKTAGQTLSVSGGTTTLVVNGAFTQTLGNFTAPATMSVSGNTTLTAGTFTAPSNLNLSGDFTNNGATFTAGTGTVSMNGSGFAIGGSTATAFNNLILVTGNTTLNATVTTSGLLTVNNGANLIVSGASTITPVSATINGTVTVTGTGSLVKGSGVITYNSGSTYNHNRDGGAIPIATWDVNSTCLVSGIIATAPTVATFSQAFGNFTWNCPAQTGNVSLAGNLTDINGNFSISNTNSGSLRLINAGANRSLIVDGNFIQSGGTFFVFGDVDSPGNQSLLNILGDFSLSNGTFNLTGSSATGVLNVAKNFSFSNGTITKSGSGTANFNFNGTTTQLYSKTGGAFTNTINFGIDTNSTVDFGTSIIDGSSGTFNLLGSGTVLTKNTGGFALTGATGTVQVTGTRVYSAAANYEFNGTLAQVIGTGVVTANNITINNTLGATLSTSTTINNLLSLTSGRLTLGANNLIFGTTALPVAGTLNASNMIDAGSTGQVRKLVSANGAYTLPIGEIVGTADYSPITINLTSGTYAGGAFVAANVTNAKHPNNNYTKYYLNRYFTVASSGITAFTANLEAQFLNTDTVGLASNQITARYASGVWTNFSLLTNNLLKANGLTSFGDFTGISNIPEISISTNSLSGFTYQKNAGPSTSIQSFTVTGTKLTDNVIITPPASFEVSELSGTNFIARSFVTLFPTSGNVNQLVYVRMKAGLNEGAVPSENVEVSTNGAIATLNVACSGNVTPQATITVSPVSILDYTATFKGTASAARNFTVSGTNLRGNITLEAPSGYEMKISTQSTYVSSLTVPVTPPTLVNTTINVRLKSGLGVGTYNGNIVVSSSTADNKTVALTGVVNPVATLTTSTSWLASFIYTLGNTNPAYQTFYLNGTNLTANASLSVPTTPQQQFQLSTNGSTWASTVSVPQTAGTISNALVYARLNPGLLVGNYGPTNVTISSTGAVVKTVALSGQVVNSPTIIISKNSLTGFGYLFGSTLTTSQSITVSGASLTGNITVNCPANYEISTNNVSFDSIAINLSPSSGTVAPQQIFYKLRLGRSAGTFNTTANITATGATTRTLSLFGKVFASPLISSTGGGEYCIGETINLTSSGQDVQSQFWTGPNTYYSPLPNPTLTNATTQMSGNYTVTGNVIVGGDLIVNGDFEMDNAGFSSSYGYVAPTANALYPEGLYTVTNLASNVHGNFNSTPDKNVIGTKQMIINGNVTAGAVVWTQSVPVVPNSQYEFTYWLQTVVNGTDVAPSKLQLYVNGEIAGPVYTANPTSGIWTQYIYNTASASNTILNLELINQTTAASGNDFALDSISFKQILSATSTQNVNVSASVVASVTVTHSPTNIYQNSPVVFTANPVNGGTTPSYKWYVGGVVQAGETAQTFSYTPTTLGGVTITCEMTSSIKCAAPKPAIGSDPIVVVAQPANYWMGYIDTDWGKEGNWTANIIPATGDNVIYATVANFGVAAIKDLHLDKNRTIGSLINATIRRLVIPANLTLICNNTITVTPPITNPITNKQDLIYIYASTTLPNGSIKYNNPTNNPAFGTIEMYSPASWDLSRPINEKFNWQFFGIPVTAVPALPTFYGAHVRELFENDKDTATHWRSLKNESVLQPFIGYELCQQNPKFYTFKGQLVNSNFSSGQFIKTTGALYPGQHLFANPYAAAMDIRQIEFGAGVEATAYLYSTGTFVQWRSLKKSIKGSIPGQYFAVPKNQAGSVEGIPRQVPSMGTLMVRVPPIAQSTELSYVNFNYNNVAMGNSERQRAKAASATDNQTTTTIDIEGENSADRMWLMSHESYTRGFDNGFDGKKLIGNALNPQLYAVENDGKYQLNSVDDINNTTLAFQAGQDTEYNMTFTHDENAQLKYKKMYLHDLVENKIIDISMSGTIYNFNAVSTTNPVIRFKILSQSVNDEIGKVSNTKVYHYDNQLYVQNFSEFDGNVYVYDISGRTVGIKSISGYQNIQIAAPKNNTYIVKIVVGNITETAKIFLQ